MHRVTIVYLLLVNSWSMVSAWWTSGDPIYIGPPRDKNSPNIRCPDDIHVIADPFQVNTKVSWDENFVVANDDRDGSLTVRRTGLAPGLLFSEGTNTVRYSATDRSGNVASCTFRIIVKVLTCKKWNHIKDGWKICHVSHDDSHVRRGSVCRFGCYGGHELVGPDRSTCLDTEQWDISMQPFCQKIQCPDVFPTTDKVTIDCSDGFYYRSACSYNCLSGYSVLPGYSNVRVCNEFGSWIGSEPECVDTEPPKYVTCPDGVTDYAEHTKTSGRVWWEKPKAKDNSGNTVTVQLSGPSPGTDLEVGEYDVAYMSYDAVNNTAMCEFTVVVKQIKCHTIYPLPYTSVVCPIGRIYGSTCEFHCDNGTALNGYKYAECTKEGFTVPYGEWNFPASENQPYCEQESACPALRPPDNGALACDTWMSGSFCQMLCQENHVVTDDLSTIIDERDVHATLLVCSDSGFWSYNMSDIPNCQKKSAGRFNRLMIKLDYLYYTGECPGSMDEIKQNFIEAAQTGLLGTGCNPSICNVNNVKVICGRITERDTSKHKRDVSEGFTLEYSVELPNDINSDEAFQIHTNITNSLNTAMKYGRFDIEVDDEMVSPIVKVSDLELQCSDGSVFDQRSLMCVECIAGYFFNSEYKTCSRCPIGYYQDENKQTSCKVCPTGTTTESKGASSLYQCKDACEAGFYSNTGTEPCTVCDLGTYSTGHGSTSCTSCPASQITLKAAATSISECQDFDISYTMMNYTDTSFPASLLVKDMTNLNNMTLSFWVKCSHCDQILEIVDTDGTQLINIENKGQLRFALHGLTYETNVNITGSDTWKRIIVTTTDGVITVYIDSHVVVNDVFSQQLSNNSVNITVGGDSFIGSISQLNIWSVPLTDPPSSINSCFNDVTGDIVAWREFYELDGTFTFTKSKCDAIDNCGGLPCQNGGLCSDGIDSFSCACAEGFAGRVCEINIDDCLANVCDNGATCVDGVASYTCQCAQGFKGNFCETKYVDGGWTEWVASGGCSVTCGIGVQTRSRVCENPEPSNGGKQCDGDPNELVECETNTTCLLDCQTDPPDIENGNINCTWVDENNDTRVCQPFCDDGFAFDSDMFVYTSGISCGPDSGYTWNINTTDNPLLQLPSCTAKTSAVTNILNYTMEYTTLHSLSVEVIELIEQNANSVLNEKGCVDTGCCAQQTMVYTSTNNVNNSVLLTIQLTCSVQNEIDECYNILSDLVQTLDDLIKQEQFTVQYEEEDYPVGINSRSLDGISTCLPGHVPVFNFCVACGRGTYAYNNYCEVCPVGTYQDMEAQTSCKSCPQDRTTAGYMTRHSDLCNVYIYVESNDSQGLLTGLAFGLSSAALIMILLGAGLMYKRQRSHSEVGVLSTAGGMLNAKPKFNLNWRQLSLHSYDENFDADNEVRSLKPNVPLGSVDCTPQSKEDSK